MARVQSTKKAPATAKKAPVVKTNIVKSEELEVAPEKTVEFVRQESGIVREESGIELEGNIYGLNDKAAYLAFLEEPVTINIAEGTEKDAEKYVFLSVNGIGAGPNGLEYVPRGVDVVVKRKYVNVLANARRVRFTNYEYTTPEGERKSAQKGASADQYPFSVIEDTPKGREWLKQLRANRRA